MKNKIFVLAEKHKNALPGFVSQYTLDPRESFGFSSIFTSSDLDTSYGF